MSAFHMREFSAQVHIEADRGRRAVPVDPLIQEVGHSALEDQSCESGAYREHLRTVSAPTQFEAIRSKRHSDGMAEPKTKSAGAVHSGDSGES